MITHRDGSKFLFGKAQFTSAENFLAHIERHPVIGGDSGKKSHQRRKKQRRRRKRERERERERERVNKRERMKM